MSKAANNFLNSLTPEQRAKATYKFEDDQRFDWHFIPKERKGLPLREMTARQKELAQALLCAGLSQQGYVKAVSIMSLEEVLRLIEGSSTEYRNPEKYFFTVFGTPSDNGHLGLSRGRPSRGAELHHRERQGDRRAQLLRLESGGSAGRDRTRDCASCRRKRTWAASC